MKKLYGSIMAYSLYYLGDLVSKPMYWHDIFARAYPVYNWLMLKSSDYQDDYELAGPWSRDPVDGDLLVQTMELEEENAKDQ